MRVLFFIVAFLAACSSTPREPLTTGDLTRRELTRDVWVVTHEKPWPANSLVYLTRGGDIVLVGTPYTPEATSQLLDQIAARYAGARITAINPHFHDDAAGGNAALIARGIAVHGSDLTAELIRKEGATPPDHIFPLGETQHLTIGGETIEIFYPGPAHSPDNIVVWFPRRRVLFGTCMVRTGGKLGNLSDADVQSWGDSVARLRRFDARFVVPGHGLEFSPSLIDETERAARQAAAP